MKNSFRAYLERQPAEGLEAFLKNTKETDTESNYLEAIPVILEVLEKKRSLSAKE